MKRFIYILFICVCLTACTKCKKDKKPDQKTDYGQYAPSINLADYCFFKQGSYWIYQDSVSGTIDCTYVTTANITTYTIDVNSGKDYTGIFHYYNMFIKDKIGDERQYEIHDEDAAQTGKCCNSRYRCEAHWNRPPSQADSMGNSTPGIYFGAYTHMFNDFTYGTEGGGFGYGETCTSKGTINNLQVNTFPFNNIVVFENHINISDGNWTTHQYRFKNYISNHKGIIKRIDIDSNRVWLLKKFNAIQ